MSVIRFINGSNNDRQYLIDKLAYLSSPAKTKGDHQMGANGCSPETPLDGMLAVKKLYHKTGGRQGIHLVVSPSSDSRYIDDKTYLRLADQIAFLFPDFQSYYVLHKDTARRHVHIVLNTVSYKDGRKFGQSKAELNRFRQRCNEILEKLGFDISTDSSNEFWDLTDYSNETDFDFLEIDESVIPDHRVSGNLEIDPSTDPLFAESSEWSSEQPPYPNPLDPEYNNYIFGDFTMKNIISDMNKNPFAFDMVPTQNQSMPAFQKNTQLPVATSSEAQSSCTPDILSPAFPTMVVNNGPRIIVHAETVEEVIPLINEVSQRAHDQSVDAANLAWAMHKKSQEAGFPANTVVSNSPFIEIDLTGQLSDIPIIDTELNPDE